MTDFAWPIILIVNAVLVLLVGMLVLWKIHKDKKSGYPIQDERTTKISGKAAIGTYYINLAFMISLGLFIIFGTKFLDLPELDAGWAIIAIMLVSGISYGLLSLYYSRKGDFLMRTRIKELRARHDLTQDDLAKMVGVRRETILYLEKGKYNPSLKLAHDVAEALKTTIDDLFVFDD